MPEGDCNVKHNFQINRRGATTFDSCLGEVKYIYFFALVTREANI